ncbi:MAG: hypothetical protein IH820_17805, partial [Bacteroidetes bacterium]|nr:hypothetical protein [Bacteroidota bacterium]
MSARFDLEKAIAAWRRTFTYHRAFLKEDVDELERHLHDHVAYLIAAGAKPVDAFKEALRTLGDFTGAAEEYRKVYWGKIKRRRRLLREVIWHPVMLNNYLKVTLRNLRRQPVYTVINVAGLAIGLTCFVLLILFVQDERSYDRFHDNADRIYRMVVDVEASQGVQHTAKSPPIWANALLTDFPEVAG